MLPAQIIQEKRDGHPLSQEEIRFFILGFTRADVHLPEVTLVLAAELFEIAHMEKNVAAARGMLQKKRLSDGSPEELAR